MSANTTLSPDGRTLTVTVPMALRRRGGRKLILLPEDAAPLPVFWLPATSTAVTVGASATPRKCTAVFWAVEAVVTDPLSGSVSDAVTVAVSFRPELWLALLQSFQSCGAWT